MKTAVWPIDATWQEAFDGAKQQASQKVWAQALTHTNDLVSDMAWVESMLKHYAQNPCLVWVDGMFQAQYSTASYQRQSLSETQQLSSLQDYFASLGAGQQTVSALLPLCYGREFDQYVFSDNKAQTIQLLHFVSQPGVVAHCAAYAVAQGQFEFQQRTLVKPGIKAFMSQQCSLELGKNAVVRHVQVHQDQANLHYAWRVKQHQASDYQYRALVLSQGHQKTYITVDQLGERAQTQLSGLLMGKACAEHHEHWQVNHRAAHGQSDMHFRAIMGGQSQASWQGHAHVDEATPHCAITQMCRQLMTSDQARMHAKPTLTIYCDEVTCTHGATSGQLDEAALFYCQSRGLGLEQAQSLLMMAFVNELVAAWNQPWLDRLVREYLNQDVMCITEVVDECVT